LSERFGVKPIVLINAAAGSAYQVGEAASELIERGFARFGIAAQIEMIQPGDLIPALERARQRERPVIVAGGDGSVSAAIQIFANTDIPMGVIPLGTYNLLGQDLGVAGDLEEAVAQLASARITQIDLGRIGERYFHTLAGVGFFARAAQNRAEIRKRLPGAKVVGALVAAVKSLTSGGCLDVEIHNGSERRMYRTPALLITSNVVEASTWRRPRLDEGVLELHVARGDIPFSLLKGGVAAIRGTWRQSEGVETWVSQQFQLRFRRPKVFVSLDGEVLRRHTPLHFQVVPKALTCLMAPDDAKKQTA